MPQSSSQNRSVSGRFRHLTRLPSSLTALVVAALFLALLGAHGSHPRIPPVALIDPPQPSPGPGTVLWVFAHPDDETLMAAGALMDSADQGYRNVVVIVTGGGAVPLEGPVELSGEEVVAAREAEARAALSHVEPEHLVFMGLPDRALTVVRARQVIDELLGAYPEAIAVRGHSPWDPYLSNPCGHPDHCAIGIALVEASRAGKIHDLVMYRIGHLFDQPPGGDGCTPLSPEQRRTKQAMRAEYELTRPHEGRYGIGGDSVPTAWTATEWAPECWDLPRDDPLPRLVVSPD